MTFEWHQMEFDEAGFIVPPHRPHPANQPVHCAGRDVTGRVEGCKKAAAAAERV